MLLELVLELVERHLSSVVRVSVKARICSIELLELELELVVRYPRDTYGTRTKGMSSPCTESQARSLGMERRL